MARAFNGTSQSMRSASTLAALAGLQTVAVSYWYYGPNGTLANDDTILASHDDTWNTSGTFFFTHNPIDSPFNQLPDPSPPLFEIHSNTGAGYTSARQLNPAPSSYEWHHFLIEMNFNAAGGTTFTNGVQSVYVDGVYAPGIDALTYPSVDLMVAGYLNVMGYNNNAAMWANGSIADLCIWSTTELMIDEEIADLVGGRRAHTVRQEEIIYYWPLTGTASPEPAGIGGINLNLLGGPVASADPPVLDPFTGVAPAHVPLSFTLTRTNATTAVLDWGTLPDDAADGVTIVRYPQSIITDYNGKRFGQSRYNPLNVPGITLLASGVTGTGYTDDTLDPNTNYSYAIARTGSTG